MNIVHRTFLVRGHVQGVFYRQSTQQEARRLGLVGIVRNNPDNTVTIKAEGPDEALRQLETWCHHGPVAARVTGVGVTEGEVQGYPDFRVER